MSNHVVKSNAKGETMEFVVPGHGKITRKVNVAKNGVITATYKEVKYQVVKGDFFYTVIRSEKQANGTYKEIKEQHSFPYGAVEIKK